jgi:hypothetical protein
MIKDHVRDYATDAFRYFAYLGQPHKEDLENKYYEEALEQYQRTHEKGCGISKPTEQAIMYAEGCLRDKQAELWDILAVEKTLMQLHREERQAVEIVYFQHAQRQIKRGEIRDRVIEASLNVPAGERTIYRYLYKARMIFAYERGLRK